MKYLKHFENAQEAATVLATWPFNTISSIEGVQGASINVGVAPTPTGNDHYIGTINNTAEEIYSFRILAGGECGGWGWIPSRVVVDGVELEELSEYIDLAPGLHTIEIWDDPNSTGYYDMYQNSGYFIQCNYSSMIIPDYVTEVGESAFNSNGSLASVTIPGSVTRIGHTAFLSCMELTSIICNAINPPTLGENTLEYTNDCPIYVPASSVDAYKASEDWSEYASRIQAIQ